MLRIADSIFNSTSKVSNVFATVITGAIARQWLRRFFSYSIFMTVSLLSTGFAHATILGLGDGTYDVTLTCIQVNCGGPFTGSLTVVGSDGTAWSFNTAFDNFPLSFSGDPTEEIIPPPTDLQFLRGNAAAPFQSFQLQLTTFPINGLPSWDISTGGVSLNLGTWTAAPAGQGQIPEPASLGLIISGLVAVGVRALRRRIH